ncbi:hypothetical protein [Hasllibacter sp. MH4015]|uniref:hypothetical protein n=1 Tax=Hasllibacter sp. MH4015 TaxID=2854029 RepID=UPI001CD557F8|nr:hypothetical protein [Hasllibacter sp. MH4015]
MDVPFPLPETRAVTGRKDSQFRMIGASAARSLAPVAQMIMGKGRARCDSGADASEGPV